MRIKQVFIDLIRIIFITISIWALWSWQIIVFSLYGDHPITALFKLMTFCYSITIILLLIFLCLKFRKSYLVTIIVIILTLLHVILGWNRMTDSCYREILRGKGFDSEYQIYSSKVCFAAKEANNMRWILREAKGVDPKTFKFVGIEDDIEYFKDKNCLYKVEDYKLKCIKNLK